MTPRQQGNCCIREEFSTDSRPALRAATPYRRQGRLICSVERGAKSSGVTAKQLPVSCLDEHLVRRGVKNDPPYIQTDDSPVRQANLGIEARLCLPNNVPGCLVGRHVAAAAPPAEGCQRGRRSPRTDLTLAELVTIATPPDPYQVTPTPSLNWPSRALAA
jgi:hypothetical protein